MSENDLSFQEITQRVKTHKEKELEWCLRRDEYMKKISILMGQKAAYSLCLETLQKQIEDVKNKILLAKGISPPPPTTTPENKQEEPQQPAISQEVPIFTQAPSIINVIAKKASEKASASSTPQASPAKSEITKPDAKPKETKEKPKKKKRSAASKSSKPAALKYTINIHLDSIRAVCFYNSLPIVVSASDDGTIRLTNCEPVSASGKKVRNPVNFASLRGHSAPVICLTPFELNKHQYMLSGSFDGTIGLWDLPLKQSNIYDG